MFVLSYRLKSFIINKVLLGSLHHAPVSNQEPHPPRMSAENAVRRHARLDTVPPNIFEQLKKLRPFVEVSSYQVLSLFL